MRGYDSGSRAVQNYMRSRHVLPDSHTVHEPAPPTALSIPSIGPTHRVPQDHAHEVIDLLNVEPALIVDADRLRWALSFGFAGGDIGGLLLAAMRKSPVAESDWKPEGFSAGLFVTDLLRTSMLVRIGTLEPNVDSLFLARVFTHPPRDPRVTEYRHAILRELTQDPVLRSRFNETYAGLHRLREMLDSQGPSRELDGRRRRLDVLASIRDVLLRMHSGFADCESGLSRIHRFAEHSVTSPGFRQLVELLDYENHLANVDVKLGIGADGRIRHFAVTRVTENTGNRFYQSPFGRWLARIGLMLRGYSLGESEIANRWVDAAFEGVQQFLIPMMQLLGEMEFYLATLAFKDAAESRGLRVSLPELRDQESTRTQLEGLFNPLLFAMPAGICTCDFDLGTFRNTTLVTGPNSGGKTRLLQAIAIAQMLGQSGGFVPAKNATLTRASGLFVSLIEEARADQKEGRLGTELLRIRKLFEEARPGSLIVLDELCSGTNPSEGEEIIRLVLSLLGELRASVFITTHFLQFATRLAAEAPTVGNGLRFLQVELDDRECPTYKFVPGVAKTSLAHQTAERLGVTHDALLSLVRKNQQA